ncbi:MAG: 1,6-dihydroxycyclohexa-2,4-diene-1-carboxylate dehydrogenase, partial [Propionibacteriaceae bacterium]|nr:1,6-dihydroxycyclohexa-2,4-diene-1-carboxylate dehydrogenase [Propionibacteriaceae bacterium]
PRTIMGQEIFAASDIESLAGSEISGIAATFIPTQTDEYEIGEEHPAIQKSDAIFEARQALELGAIELVLGRLNSQQIAAYRMLAEATVPYVKGDQFTDPLGFTETNAAFHDYLFTMTNNQHLLQAYQRLGVKGEMEEVLKNAHWCHPLIAKDHLDMVDAIEAGDRQRARDLFVAHADRSKLTMRRAMQESQATPFVSPGRFAGKVVLITGAAQGIGEAVARRIHAEGGKLVLADRSELVEGVATKLAQTGSEAISTLVDLETMAGAQQVVDTALAKFGRIDVAIHVVGGTIWRKPFDQYAEDEIVKEINRSLYPTMWSCRAVLPHLYERGKGTIVNVSSVATTGLNRLPYAAAKGGVNALTRSLAWEAAEHGVRVVATAPGGTDAPPRKIPRGGEPQNAAEEAWHQTTVDQTIDSSLLKRYGSLDEQAAAICFLASDEASYITGTTLPVAG